MSDTTDLAGRVQQLEAQVAELQKAIEVLVHKPNWRELISLSPRKAAARLARSWQQP